MKKPDSFYIYPNATGLRNHNNIIQGVWVLYCLPLFAILKRGSIVCVIFILNIALRFALISQGPYNADCLLFADTVQKIVESGQMHYLQGTGLPLTAVLGAIFHIVLKSIGINDAVFAVNLMSVVLSSCAIVFFYLFSRNLLGKQTALYSAALFSIFPIFLAISTFGNSHPPTILFLLMSLYLISTYAKTKNYFYFILGSLCFGLTGAARLQDALPLFPAMVCYVGIISNENTNDIIKWSQLTKLSLTFLSISVLVLALFYLPHFALQRSELLSYQFNYQGGLLLKNFCYLDLDALTLSLKYIYRSFSPIGCLTSLFGFVLLLRKRSIYTPFLLLFSVIPFYFFGNIIFTLPRFFIITSIPLILFQGYALSFLKNQKNLLCFLSIPILAYSLYTMFTFITPSLMFRHHNSLLPNFYKWIAFKTEPNAVLIDRDSSSFVKHYARRIYMRPPAGLDQMKKDDLMAFKEQLDDHLNKGIPVYITGTGLFGMREEFQFDEFINKHYHLEWIGKNYIEDWHMGELDQLIGSISLYRLTKKSP